MQGLAHGEHHVVGDVDHVRDRPLARGREPLLEPQRRWPDLHVLEHPRGEAQADLGIDLDRRVVLGPVVAQRVGLGRAGVLGQQGPGDGVDLAGDSVDGHRVGPVGGYLELEHLVCDGKVVGERLPDRQPVGQHDDARVVLSYPELVLGEDHPARPDAAQLGLAQLAAVGHYGAGQGHRHGLAGRDVGGATDDRAGFALARLDHAHAEAIRVGMPLGLEHASDDEHRRVAHPDAMQALELDPCHRQGVGDLLGREAGVAVGAQPRRRDPHAPAPNWSRRRRSFS